MAGDFPYPGGSPVFCAHIRTVAYDTGLQAICDIFASIIDISPFPSGTFPREDVLISDTLIE